MAGWFGMKLGTDADPASDLEDAKRIRAAEYARAEASATGEMEGSPIWRQTYNRYYNDMIERFRREGGGTIPLQDLIQQ